MKKVCPSEQTREKFIFTLMLGDKLIEVPPRRVVLHLENEAVIFKDFGYIIASLSALYLRNMKAIPPTFRFGDFFKPVVFLENFLLVAYLDKL